MNILGAYRRAVVNEVLYPPGGRLSTRIQRNMQLVYVWSGEANVWVDGVRHHVEAGRQILLLPHHRERFRFSNRVPTHHGWCELTNPTLPEDLERFIRESAPSVVQISPRTKRLVAEALTLRGATDPVSVEMRRHLVESILLEHLHNLTALSTTTLSSVVALSLPADSPHTLPQHAPAVLLRALQIIREDFREIGSVAEIASKAGCSAQHLARLFARHVGTSPGNALWQIRTDHAIELIRSTGLALDQVAAQSGFQTAAHLSRRVKDCAGASPRALRSQDGLGQASE